MLCFLKDSTVISTRCVSCTMRSKIASENKQSGSDLVFAHLLGIKLNNLFDFVQTDCFIGHVYLCLQCQFITIWQIIKITALKQYHQIKNAGPSKHETGGVSLDCSGGVSLIGISTKPLVNI